MMAGYGLRPEARPMRLEHGDHRRFPSGSAIPWHAARFLLCPHLSGDVVGARHFPCCGDRAVGAGARSSPFWRRSPARTPRHLYRYLAAAVAFRAKLWNIGAEAQFRWAP